MTQLEFHVKIQVEAFAIINFCTSNMLFYYLSQQMMNPEDTCHEAQFTHFFQGNADDLRNFIYYKSGDLNLAEDTAQEAFARLWQNCAKVPLSKARSFLFTTAVNLLRDLFKHKKVQLKFAEQPTKSETNEDPEFLMEEKEFDQKLKRVLGGLTEDQRTCFLMNRIDGLKYREIADVLDVSVKTVEKRIHKALIVLRKEIGNI